MNAKGLAKLGNIVADANVSQLSRAGNMCCGNKFCCSETKTVFAWSQKHFCFPDTNFASETYVSQFSHPGKHIWYKQLSLNFHREEIEKLALRAF